jgi:ATP-dependent DNA helicase DinG
MSKPPAHVKSYLADEAIFFMRHEIQHAGGNEVFFVGKVNPEGVVESVQTVARGNQDMVPAIINNVHTGDAVIHNHPSGGLQPSNADASLASQLGNEAVAFYIVNNYVSEIYVVVEPQKPKGIVKLSPPKLAAFLGENGPLAQRLENYEVRPQQQKMLEHVAEAFNEKKIAVIEAGTGTGKTLAYLLPAIEWSVRNRERTVIATGTINLQEQLINKDIPLLQAAHDLHFRAALVKGRTNYACRRKLLEVSTQLDMFSEPSQQNELQMIVEWAQKTADGSKSDLGFIPNEMVWEKIQSESDTTLRAKCPFYNECFFYNARRRAASADILVANHHILFADLAVRNETGGSSEVAVLPKYQRIILDEAHDIEDVASSYFGAATSYHAFLRVLNKLYRIKDAKTTGLLPFALSKLEKQSHKLSNELLLKFHQHIEGLCEPSVQNVEYHLSQVMERLFVWGAKQRKTEFAETKIRLKPAVTRDPFFQDILQKQAKPFLNALQSCTEELVKLNALFDNAEHFIGDEAVSLAVDINAQTNRLMEMGEKFKQVLFNNDEKFVRWLELKESRWGNIVRLYNAPLNVSELMQKAVFNAFPTVVMTSATLAVGKSFEFLEERLGLAGVKEERRVAVKLDSPFDYPRQVLVAIPTDIPAPTEGGYAAELKKLLSRTLDISQGRAFILFTSYSLLNQVYNQLAPELSAKGMLVLKQGGENRHRLLERFKAQVGSVLFGTDSFWQGVDVHGEALECVIIPRLPFRVPTEPLIEARVEAIDKAGGNSFMEFSVPQAVIKFKQGFGRLIRRKSDFGVIAIFDNRIATKFYGKLFMESLPECRIAGGASEEVFEEMRRFYKRQRG